MPWVRVIGRPHHRRVNGRLVKYVKGDSFMGTADEARNLSDRLVEVATPEASIQLPFDARRPDASAEARRSAARQAEEDEERRRQEAEAKDDEDLPASGTSDVQEIASDLTVAQLRKMGEDLGIDLPAKATKAELRAKIDEEIARM